MMKNIMKKLFISALVVSTATLATTSAVTINVGNRSSHGILNLDRLAIKASTESNATDAVVLSSGGKVWVAQICSDTTLNNCKNVADLLTDVTVNNTNNTLQWSSSTTIATVAWHDIKVTMPAQPTWWEGTDILTWSNGKYCKYVDTSGWDGRVWDLVLVWEWEWEKWIKCIYDGPLWELGNVTNASMTINKVLKPIDLTKDIYIASDIWHDGEIKIEALWTHEAYRKNTITIHGHWVYIWEEAYKTAGLWVHWPITVWKWSLTDEEEAALASAHPWQCVLVPEWNTISIYATGAWQNENFEILGSNRIALWVREGAYIYFDKDGGNNWRNIWINQKSPKAVLDINWGVRVWDCWFENCTKTNVWEIRYYENSNGTKWYFVWCRRKNSGNDLGSFERVVLSDWTTAVNTISNTCDDLTLPYNVSTYESVTWIHEVNSVCDS